MAGLSATQVERYRRDGYVFPVPALTRDETSELRDWLAAFEARHSAVPAKQRRETLLRFKPHLLHPVLHRVVSHPHILDAVESLIGPDILVWSSAFFIKDAHDPAFISWHQDSITYGLAGDDLVSAWIALVDVDPGNGAMKFLPGSHRVGPVEHRFIANAANMSSLGETIPTIDEKRAVGIGLSAGEMSLHNIHLMHASDPNDSGRPRLVYVVRYVPTSERVRQGRASALLVRGSDRFGHFEFETPPLDENDPATIAAHDRATRLRMARTFSNQAS
jgi:hypothetical protein